MVAHLLYWLFFILIAIINIIIILKKGIQLIDYIMYLSVAVASAFGDQILAGFFHLFTYISTSIDDLYSAFYIAFVYPSCGIWFSKLFPRIITLRSVLMYCIKWTVFLMIVEILIITPSGIIIYKGWKIFPHSLIFYILTLPVFSIYYILFLNIIKKESSQAD